MNGELYIGGKRADCDEEALALFTYRRENLDNPTVVRNSYTQQIRLKGTPANRDIFGHFTQGTRIAGSTGFDATARTPFALYSNHGEIVESGYCKLDAVESKGTDHTYLVTLYGGLGEILYKLGVDEVSGAQRTLADLDYLGGLTPAAELDFTIEASVIYNAWENLRGAGLPDDRWKVINFPPCYEGHPSDDFDADKIIAPVDGTNLLGSSGGYSAYSGHVCVTLGCGKVSAQQVADFRCYLQRVAISVKAIFDGIDRFCTAEGWTLSLDADFFKAGNKYYADTWVLLQQLSALGYKQGDTATKAGLLGGTPSPLNFLIGYCRQFGLVITADHAANILNIQTRKNYYDSALAQLDLSDRVDLSQQIGTTPVTMTSRWLDFGLAGKGAFLDQYNENYRTPYGYKRIDTGYAFNNDVTDLLEGDVFETVAEVAEVGIGMGEVYRIDVRPGAPPDVADVVGSAGSSYELMNGTDRLTLSPGTNGLGGSVTGRRLAQLHDASYKGVDAFALVFYRGSDDLGTDECVFLTNDNATYFDALNGGRPCWHWIDDAASRLAVQYVPQFGRYIYSGNDVDLSLDIYPPQVLGFTLSGDYDEDAAIFAQFWADYIGDRYDADAKIVTVKANLAGLPRPAELLRRFVWWDGALWSVNAVKDYDPLGASLTTLELVRVTDPAKYRTLNL